ncbi:mitogen-activated protein kinase kinase kinase 1 [Artemisia annua]|uniref:mitogen-activated protein kinase kinase kinase n=1 Tax=Artemisia annua TaxID=35608 RepID=A0A2U1NNS5_ARTAN|nr:mitogen-activated protein kinase kinase kinase 1 [Artemisia annua]
MEGGNLSHNASAIPLIARLGNVGTLSIIALQTQRFTLIGTYGIQELIPLPLDISHLSLTKASLLVSKVYNHGIRSLRIEIKTRATQEFSQNKVESPLETFFMNERLKANPMSSVAKEELTMLSHIPFFRPAPVVRGVKVVSGIKGVRPPVLATPELEGLEEVRVRMERTCLLSASCSFSTSNDDDSSSSTTEPPSSVSPNKYGSNVSSNGRFRNIKITNWQRGELLGRGSFGSVYEGICDGGYFIAVKEVSLLDSGELGRQSVVQLEQEIALLSQFEHENIVRYYGTDKDESKLYIFLELVTKGSLLSLYQRYHLQDCQVSSYTRQILHGLKYLHDRSVVHRDVKCANILVDANGSVKLADFGLAKATKFNDVRSCKGTAFWMAPEVVNQKNKGYGLAADIWSLGCTVLEMLTRRIPYSPMECMAALFRIGSGIAPPVPDSLSKEAKDFISQCFLVNPRDRPTASQLLDHPFVRRPLPSFSDYASSGQSSSRMR